MPSTVYPTLTLQLSTAAPAAAPTWQDITPYLISGTYKRGRAFELDQIQAGTADFTVLNNDRRFDPTYTTGPYYPNLLPLRRMQLTAEWQGTTYPLWSGYLESIDQVWPAKGAKVAFATLKCVDAFEILARRILTSAVSTLTTSTGVSDGDLTFTTRGAGSVVGPGGDGRSFGYGWARKGSPSGSAASGPISIQYIQTPDADPGTGNVAVDTTTGLITDSYQAGSAPTGRRAIRIMGDINAHAIAGQMVHATLAPGSTGQGHIANYGPVAMSFQYTQERSDLRVKRVLDSIGWSATDRVLRTGTSIIQLTQFQSTDNLTPLQHIQDVTATELGIFFIDGQNRTVFYDRNHRTVSPWNTSQATFSDDPYAANPYIDLVPAYDSRYLYNKITVTRNGGVAQTTSDATSITSFLTRELNISSIAASDGASAATATALLARYKNIKMRYDSITVAPDGTGSTMWTKILGFDISTRITVQRTPPGGAQQWSQDCYIESISHQFSRHMQSWQTQWGLSPA